MNSELTPCRSLPPLVEGKIHGSLRFVINEILWVRKSPGDVTVVASWWGEHDNAQFRLIDGITDTANENTTEIYAVKTNATLFEDYVKNSKTIELVFVAEKTHSIIGTAHVGKLFKIFLCKHYSQCAPIVSNSGNRIGKIHVSLELRYITTKFPYIQLKTYKYTKKQVDDNTLLSNIDDLQYNREISVTSYKNMDNIKDKNSMKYVNLDTYDTYRSILKTKRQEFQESRKKFNEMVTSKLVAQVLAKAQRLRGEILKETYNEDSLALSDSSMSNGLYSYASVENEVKLYEYILGTEMTSSGEKEALDTLRSTSLTSSLIDLASKTITTNKDDNINNKSNKNSLVKLNNPVEDASYKEMTYTKLKGMHLLDHVDSIRIFIESFTLSSIGYRHVKSICKQYGVPLLPIYFIQYDTTFTSVKQTNMKSNKEKKFIRIYAKKQVGQVIDFSFEGIYSISRYIVNTNFSLRFKIFGRHLNKKFPTELGFGSMNISSDIAKTTNLSSTQHIVIINKGIKMGELKVTAELGCGFIYFGKEFVDAVISAKENIPVLEIKSLMSMNGNKYKSATGAHSSKSNKISSVSAKRIECLTSNSNKDLITTKNVEKHQEQNSDNKKIDISNPESDIEDKILLHGLIYIAEGKDLPEFNTYLICRAFWRENKGTSQMCSNTKNPFYQFFQIVSLIHGIELLNRIRNNYIIIEIYSRQKNGTDNLLGIAKLPVHQLYVAYKDPVILPHLLLSKYPVISVDGWVSINNLVSGKSCGELLALVALGTAEQIALLEVSRGLRNISTISRTIYNHHRCIPDNMSNAISGQENLQYNTFKVLNLNSKQSTRDNNFAYHIYSTSDQDSMIADYKTQESQTDVSSLKDTKLEKSVQRAEVSEHLALHVLVDRLANVLHVNQNSTDQSVQTDVNPVDKEEADRGELCLNNSNDLTDDSDSCNLRNNFLLPTEICRSVGVGAEYDENCQQLNTAYNDFPNVSIMGRDTERKEPNANSNISFFRSVIEIECALHLPKIEGLNESIEPSTYVTFQDLTHKLDSSDQLNSYAVTNVFLHSCNPKWNWRCDAKLPTDLLLNSQKRLIFKVWHLIDPDTSTETNLEKDIVIGFSAVDLSVLIAGFPTVSGWFHIMDFIGKCNGQIKITITPLDSLQPLRKFALTSTTNLSQINWPHLYKTSYNNAKPNNAHQISYTSHNKERFVQSNRKPNDLVVDIDHSLEDVSMSFLSSSLKQKLTELDDITKRLQSRLRDVTNAAFEDEFDNDFDMIEPNSDNENIDDRNIEIVTSQCTVSVYSANGTLEVSKQCKTKNDRNIINDENKQITSIISNNYNPHFELPSNQNRIISSEAAEYCSSSNTRFSGHAGYYHNQYQNRYSLTRNYLSDNSAEYPARGTKTHINHLLDKLSLNLPPKPSPRATIPMKKDILELFASLREHRNNLQDKDKNDCCINTCSVLTQTDDLSEQHAYFHAENLASDTTIENIPKSSAESQHRNRISTIIREELVAEENNDSTNYDELTTYLITSNVRHMDLDNIFNPLLYQHLIPDPQVVAAKLLEGEAAEQLDNRYTSFGAAICDSKISHSTENDGLSRNEAQLKNRTIVLQSEKNTELLHLISSGISENVDSSIDITVTYKSNDNDLTSDNSTESNVIASFDKPSVQQADIKFINYCSAISELSVTEVSRQAPEGGNPEEVKISIIAKQQNDIKDVSEVN